MELYRAGFTIKRFAKNVFHLAMLCFFDIIGLVSLLFSKKYRNVWLFAERGTDAQDSGAALFEYVCKNHPEIKSYYIIGKDADEYEKMAKIGNVTIFNSFMHHFLFSVSEYKISTHIMGCSFDSACYVNLDKLGLIRGRKIFLQHGITKDNQDTLKYPRAKLDLFVCGAKPEYEFVRDTFNHKEGVVKYLGLCRFDNLFDTSKGKRQILLMPTWRLEMIMYNEQRFIKSKYYKAYQSLLNSPRLIKMLEENDYTLVFYPHNEVQPYLKRFSTSSDRIFIASMEKWNVQELLKSSAMLITDYSSVFFDFAYMRKPLVYYQFDDEVYRSGLHKEGYFVYKRDGFGPVTENEDELLDYTEKCIRGGCENPPEYDLRAKKHFLFNDTENCRRNFDAIAALPPKKWN